MPKGKYRDPHYFRNYFIKNTLNWKKYFINKCGLNPSCEVCSKKLQWYRKEGVKNTVYFDHRFEGINIKMIPSLWYRLHPCTEKNIKIWNKEDFGIVCCRCNNFLPTKDRLHWLKQITNYIIK